LDRRQSHVNDGSVEGLQERGEHDAGHDQDPAQAELVYA